MKTVWIVKDENWDVMIVAIAETKAKAQKLRKEHIKRVNCVSSIDKDLVYVEEQILNDFVLL